MGCGRLGSPTSIRFNVRTAHSLASFPIHIGLSKTLSFGLVLTDSLSNGRCDLLAQLVAPGTQDVYISNYKHTTLVHTLP